MSKQYFDEMAPAWEGMRQTFFSERLRDKALKTAGLPPGAAALDVGAGSGFVTEALLRAGARVTAVDQSAAMLQTLAQRFAQDDITTKVGDAEALPVTDRSHEAAFANMLLHHVEQPAQAIAEMARAVRAGGSVVITDLDTHDHRFLLDEHHDRWPGFAREDVRRWMLEAGLVDVEVTDAEEQCCATSSCGTETAKVSVFLAHGKVPTR